MTDWFYRAPARYRAIIDAAREIIPVPIWQRVERVRFLCGIDPGWIGFQDPENSHAPDGRDYRTEWHLSHAHNQMHLPASQRQTTVVIPDYFGPGPWERYDVLSLVHELGHVLHETIEWDWEAVPIDGYASSNYLEAYACAFTAWLAPDYGDWYLGFSAQKQGTDQATRHHFESFVTCS